MGIGGFGGGGSEAPETPADSTPAMPPPPPSGEAPSNSGYETGAGTASGTSSSTNQWGDDDFLSDEEAGIGSEVGSSLGEIFKGFFED